jgi:hypothetical protein
MRRVSVIAGVVIAAAAAAVAAAFVFGNEGWIKGRIVRKLEASIGGKVEIASFKLHLGKREAVLGGVVIDARRENADLHIDAEEIRLRGRQGPLAGPWRRTAVRFDKGKIESGPVKRLVRFATSDPANKPVSVRTGAGATTAGIAWWIVKGDGYGGWNALGGGVAMAN